MAEGTNLTKGQLDAARVKFFPDFKPKGGSKDNAARGGNPDPRDA